MLCKECNESMKHLMRFEKDKAYELYQCPYCHFESKKVPLKLDKTNTKQNANNKMRKANLNSKSNKGKKKSGGKKR